MNNINDRIIWIGGYLVCYLLIYNTQLTGTFHDIMLFMGLTFVFVISLLFLFFALVGLPIKNFIDFI